MKLRLLLALSLLGPAPALLGRSSAPDWLQRAAATAPAESAGTKLKAKIIHREIVHDIPDDGRITATERVAIRILQTEGRRHAVASTPFRADTDTIRAASAWLMPPQGETVAFNRKDFAEVTPAANNLYSDARTLFLSGAANAVGGAVFGYEVAVESRAIFSQLVEALQGPLPVERQVITVRPPRAWEVRSTFINHRPIEPTRENGSVTWTIPPQTALPDEPQMPGTRRLTALLGLDLILPSGAGAREKMLPRFASWTDLSLYFTGLNEAACVVDPAITAKSAELAKGAGDPLGVIRALARFAQKVNYGSIAANLGRGGGYLPHPAPLTLRRNFGDCKDKATLLRALLRVQGVESYPVSIYSGDNQAVWPEWPSPFQFNHAILAIAAPAGFASPAVIEHPKLGRLLVFDPTDDAVPFGELPVSHYGSRVLLEAGPDGGLVTLPPEPTERSVLRRVITATLEANGAISARVSEENLGSYAVAERRDLKAMTTDAYRKATHSWISSGIRGASISEFTTDDAFDENRVTVGVRVAAPAYAQSLRGKLLVFKPAMLGRRRTTAFTEETRSQPILFSPGRLEERTTITLPADFTVDELPKAVDLNTPFARYRSTCTAENQVLTLTRDIEYLRAEVAPGDYAQVRKFFEQMIKAEQAAAVLQRSTPPAATAP